MQRKNCSWDRLKVKMSHGLMRPVRLHWGGDQMESFALYPNITQFLQTSVKTAEGVLTLCWNTLRYFRIIGFPEEKDHYTIEKSTIEKKGVNSVHMRFIFIYPPYIDICSTLIFSCIAVIFTWHLNNSSSSLCIGTSIHILRWRADLSMGGYLPSDKGQLAQVRGIMHKTGEKVKRQVIAPFAGIELKSEPKTIV